MLYKSLEEKLVLAYLLKHTSDCALVDEYYFSYENRIIFRAIQDLSNEYESLEAGQVLLQDNSINKDALMHISKFNAGHLEQPLDAIKKAYLIRRGITEGREWLKEEFCTVDGEDFGKAFDEYTVSGLIDYIKQHDKWLDAMDCKMSLYQLSKPYEEWTEEDKTPPDSIIEEWMVGGSFNSIVAASKMGKTQLAMQMAWCIQNGKQFLGRNINQCDVLYMDFELPRYASAKRIEMLKKFFDKDDKPFLVDNIDGDMVRVLGIEGIVARIDRYRRTFPNLKVVFLDCFYRFFKNGDLNNAADVEQCLGKFQTYTRKYGITINVITHTNKTGIQGLDGLIYAAGGSGVWGQIVDETYGIIRSKKKDNLYTVVSTGRNFGEQRILTRKNAFTQYFFQPVDGICREDLDEEGEELSYAHISRDVLENFYPDIFEYLGEEGKNRKTFISHFPNESVLTMQQKGFLYDRERDRFVIPAMRPGDFSFSEALRAAGLPQEKACGNSVVS